MTCRPASVRRAPGVQDTIARPRQRRGELVAALWVLLAAPVMAQPTDAPEGPSVSNGALAVTKPASITVAVSKDAEGFEVEGRCRTTAPASTVWTVLTDYDGIDRFVSSMRESRVTSRTANHVVVEQVAVGRLLLFRRAMHVVLHVREEPPATIHFEDVLHRDFQSYRGTWQLEPRDGAVEIVYRVTALPGFSVPDLVVRRMFRNTVRELLSEVQAEIERRAGMAGSRSTGPALTGPGHVLEYAGRC